MVGIESIRFEREFSQGHEELGGRQHRFGILSPVVQRDPRTRCVDERVDRATFEIRGIESTEKEQLGLSAALEGFSLEDECRRRSILPGEGRNEDPEPLGISGPGHQELALPN